MKHAVAATAFLSLFVYSCAQTPAPATTPPAPAPSAEAPAPVEPTGTAKVSATTLNLRAEPRGDAASVATLKRSARVTMFDREGEWTRVQLADGRRGWVATRFLTSDSKCPADRPFHFIEAPVPLFSDDGPHGTVHVDVTVDKSGRVVSTKVTSNTTGDPQSGDRAVKEIRTAKFDPPVRNCKPVSFIYEYRRDY